MPSSSGLSVSISALSVSNSMCGTRVTVDLPLSAWTSSRLVPPHKMDFGSLSWQSAIVYCLRGSLRSTASEISLEYFSTKDCSWSRYAAPFISSEVTMGRVKNVVLVLSARYSGTKNASRPIAASAMTNSKVPSSVQAPNLTTLLGGFFFSVFSIFSTIGTKMETVTMAAMTSASITQPES